MTDEGPWHDNGNVLTQRNGTVPQQFRIYNTHTNMSNYPKGIEVCIVEIPSGEPQPQCSQCGAALWISDDRGIRCAFCGSGTITKR